MKINLGSGFKRIEGFVNVDDDPLVEPDYIVNVEKDKLPFDQLIWEFGNILNPFWVHVSYSDRHRRQILKATKINGITHYKQI
jgi:hypothetical protein